MFYVSCRSSVRRRADDSQRNQQRNLISYGITLPLSRFGRMEGFQNFKKKVASDVTNRMKFSLTEIGTELNPFLTRNDLYDKIKRSAQIL